MKQIIYLYELGELLVEKVNCIPQNPSFVKDYDGDYYRLTVSGFGGGESYLTTRYWDDFETETNHYQIISSTPTETFKNEGE